LLCAGWSLYLGKDLNFDALNYHYFIVKAFWEGKTFSSLFPASIQSYLNPVPFMPFYFFASHDWGDRATAAILGGVHGVNVFLVYLLAKEFIASKLLLNLSVLLSVLNTVFLSLIGSSFSEPVLSLIILLSLILIVRRNFVGVGFFLGGLVVGFKITNIVFILPTLIFISAERGFYFKAAALLIAGYVIGGGWWNWLLYNEFGNPVFPFLNGIFKSEFFVPSNIAFDRFHFDGVLEAISFPLKVIMPDFWVYYELPAPDVRLFVLGGGSILYISLIVIKMRHVGVFELFIIYLASVYFLWAFSSGNGRYGLPFFLLLGVALGALFERLVPFGVARVMLLILLVIQVAIVWVSGEFRWSKAAWTGEWFNISDKDIPGEMKSVPATYLSVGLQTNSYFYKYVHPDSNFINVSGQYSLSASDVKRVISKYSTKKIVFSYSYFSKSHNLKKIEEGAGVGDSLKRFDLAIEYSGCTYFGGRAEGFTELYHYLVVCSLFEKESDIDMGFYEHVFNLYEAVCINSLRPSRVPVDYSKNGPFRYYVGSEVRVSLINDRFVVNELREEEVLSLSLDEVESLAAKGLATSCF
jgi:hypothetical protein